MVELPAGLRSGSGAADTRNINLIRPVSGTAAVRGRPEARQTWDRRQRVRGPAGTHPGPAAAACSARCCAQRRRPRSCFGAWHEARPVWTARRWAATGSSATGAGAWSKPGWPAPGARPPLGATVGQMEADLDTGGGSSGVAITHCNTDNPHVHLLVRGVAQDGTDGRAHHVRFRGVEALAQAPPTGGSVVFRRFGGPDDHPRPDPCPRGRSDFDGRSPPWAQLGSTRRRPLGGGADTAQQPFERGGGRSCHCRTAAGCRFWRVPRGLRSGGRGRRGAGATR